MVPSRGRTLRSPAGPPATAWCRAKPEWRPGQVQRLVRRRSLSHHIWNVHPGKEKTDQANADNTRTDHFCFGSLDWLRVSLCQSKLDAGRRKAFGTLPKEEQRDNA